MNTKYKKEKNDVVKGKTPIKTGCESVTVAKEGGSVDLINNSRSCDATVKVKLNNTLNDITERNTKKVVGEGLVDNHECTIHEGHGLNGIVTTAKISIDNKNCIVLNARNVPIKGSGNAGIFGRALPTPDEKG